MAERSDALTIRADRTRDHLSELIDRLQNQITPAELVNQLVGRRRSTSDGPSIAETLTEQVRRNPIACVLIAAGIGWLMMSEKAERNRSAPRRRRVARRRPAAAKRQTRKRIPRVMAMARGTQAGRQPWWATALTATLMRILYGHVSEHRLTAIAAGVTYFALLAMFPFGGALQLVPNNFDGRHYVR